MIVEDEATLEGLPLLYLLQKANLNVIESIATTPNEAISMAKKKQPDIVLMDISLGNDENAGIAAAHEIQNLTNAHVIYLTGLQVSESLLQEVRKTRSYDFLVKPLDAKQVIATVRLAQLRRIEPNLVFVCYSRKELDKELKVVDELLTYLEPLAEVGVDTWIDAKVMSGSHWEKEIDKALTKAKAAVLLVSMDFINSKFIRVFELPRLLVNAKSNGTIILPIFVEHVPETYLENCGLDIFMGINTPDNPIYTWDRPKRNRDCWMKLVDELERKLGSDFN